MITLRSLVCYTVTLLMTSCSDDTNSEKRTGSETVNPYSGVSTESTPAEISGAWLVRCDVESLGGAIGSQKDSVYCRTNDENGKKAPRDISFFDSAMAAIKNLFREDQPADSLYTVKYQFDSQSLQSYKDSLYPDKTSKLNYSILEKSAFNWSAITDPITVDQGKVLLKAYANNLSAMDKIFCDENGNLKETFSETSTPSLTFKRATQKTAEASSCFISTEALTTLIENTLAVIGLPTKNTATNLVNGGGSTGCQVAVLSKVEEAKVVIRLAVLEKDRVVSEFKSPLHVTLNRLKSAAWAGQCVPTEFIKNKISAFNK